MNVHGRTTTMMPPYAADASQSCAIATLWDGVNIVGQVPLLLAKRRIWWLPHWLPFNCAPTTELEAMGLFAIVKARWERDGYTGFVPKWLRGNPL